MAPSPEPKHLNNHHKDTLLKILEHPTSHGIEWHDVLSLLEAVATVELQHDGKYLVRFGSETEVVTRPNHADIDTQQIVDLRRMLGGAGYKEVAEALHNKGREV
jgi:hypothetical protein